MEKIKVTKEQAVMLENHEDNFELLMEKRITRNCPTRIDDMSVLDVAKAFINGYEVETEFGTGDLVTAVRGMWKGDTFKLGEKWESKNRFDVLNRLGHAIGSESVDRLRVASEAEAKEYNWWDEHDRDVWELKERDVLAYVGEVEIAQVTEIEGDRVLFSCGRHLIWQSFEFIKKHMVVVCFAEDRKDI